MMDLGQTGHCGGTGQSGSLRTDCGGTGQGGSLWASEGGSLRTDCGGTGRGVSLRVSEGGSLRTDCGGMGQGVGADQRVSATLLPDFAEWLKGSLGGDPTPGHLSL